VPGVFKWIFPSNRLARRWHCIAINALCLTYDIHASDVIVVIYDNEYVAVPRLKITTLCPQTEVTIPAESV